MSRGKSSLAAALLLSCILPRPQWAFIILHGEISSRPFAIIHYNHLLHPLPISPSLHFSFQNQQNNVQDGDTLLHNIIDPIPPLDSAHLSRLEKEFYNMILDFTVFTQRDIAAVDNPRYRAIYEGVAAGSCEAAVLRAFSVIFEDLVPVRIAGRMIYRHLKDVMERQIEKRVREEERVQNRTGLSLSVIDDGRKAFMALLEYHEEDSGQLTMAQLIDSGIVQTVVEILELETFEQFVQAMEKDQYGKLNFEMFMIGLQRCTDTCDDVSCEVKDVLDEIIKRMSLYEERKKTQNDQAKKHSDKYDLMVRSFKDWEELMPSGESRMLDVLRGCFVGARNDKIVSALKIVYMDYSALRIGGDLVFNLMSKLVTNKKK